MVHFTLLLLALSLLPSQAQAFSLTPITASVEPVGPGANQSFTVDNDSDESVAAEIYVFPRTPDVNGQEPMQKVPGMDKLFMIYPPQIVLKAHEKRTVRVTWIGDAAPKKELAFRLVAEQLPVQTEKKKTKDGASIKVLLKYAGALYVTPPDAKAALKVKSSQPVAGKKLQLHLENTGTAHQILSRFVMKITSPSLTAPLLIESEQIPELNGQNVLAGAERKFELASIPTKALTSPVQVSFEFKK